MDNTVRQIANNPLSLVSRSGLVADLRAFTQQQLPEVMVPTHFIVLDDLPKLPNGKVDRNRLPKPDLEELSDAKYVPPTSRDEIRIARIWQDLLSINRVGIEDSFFDLGGDSLTVVQMAARVREEFGVELSLRRLFKNPTISALVKMISSDSKIVTSGGLSNLSNEELIAEAQLPPDIRPDASALKAASAPYKKILLTGGTGYTGAYILRELLDRSDAVIYVIVRAKDAADAVRRIRENMLEYGLLHDTDADRLIGVAGDIGRPYFSLSHSMYDELVHEVEMIIHNAALSSYAMPYKQLKPINVLGTQEVLRLACRYRIKPVHYISSLAVYQGHPGVQQFDEDVLTDPNGLVGGYRQSKWVSDSLVSLVRQHGVPTCIYRPGQITGAQDTGACATDTYLNAAIKGCIQLGVVLDFDVMLEITPVDFCAKVVAHSALSGAWLNTQFHMNVKKPISWSEFTEMIRQYGYSLEHVPYAVWYRKLSSALENGEDNALAKFFPLFGEETPSADAGDEGSKPHYVANNLQEVLVGTDIECREMDQALLYKYLDYFVSIGFLPPVDASVAKETAG